MDTTNENKEIPETGSESQLAQSDTTPTIKKTVVEPFVPSSTDIPPSLEDKPLEASSPHHKFKFLTVVLLSGAILSVLANGALGYFAASKVKTIKTQTETISALDQTIATKDVAIQDKDAVISSNSNCPAKQVCPVVAAPAATTPTTTTRKSTTTTTAATVIPAPPPPPSD